MPLEWLGRQLTLGMGTKLVLQLPGSLSLTLKNAPSATWSPNRKNPPRQAYFLGRLLKRAEVMQVWCPCKRLKPQGPSLHFLHSLIHLFIHSPTELSSPV